MILGACARHRGVVLGAVTAPTGVVGCVMLDVFATNKALTLSVVGLPSKVYVSDNSCHSERTGGQRLFYSQHLPAAERLGRCCNGVVVGAVTLSDAGPEMVR